MASLTRWTWVWVNSGSWWWTGRPGVLRFMGSQRVRHDWPTDLIWSDLRVVSKRAFWTRRPGMLRFMGSQRIGHDWATDLIWSEGKLYSYQNAKTSKVTITVLSIPSFIVPRATSVHVSLSFPCQVISSHQVAKVLEFQLQHQSFQWMFMTDFF